MQNDWRYWHKIGVNHGLIKETWQQKGKEDLEHFLRYFNQEQLSYISQFLSGSGSTTVTSADILENEGAIILAYFRAFVKSKSKIIVDYVQKAQLLEQLNQTEQSHPFLTVIALYRRARNHLVNIMLVYSWVTGKTSDAFKVDKALEEEDILHLRKRQDRIRTRLQKQESKYSIYKFRKIGDYRVGDYYYFAFAKQVDDRLEFTIGGSKRIKPARPLVFRVDLARNELQYKSNLKRVKEYAKAEINTLRRVLQTTISKSDERVIDDCKMEDFAESLIAASPSPEDSLEVAEIHFNTTKLPGLVPLIMPKGERLVDIRPAIKKLQEVEVLPLEDLQEVTKLVVSKEGKTYSIDIKPLPDGTLKLSLDERGMEEHELLVLKEAFLKQFKVPLNTPVSPKGLSHNRNDIVDYLLNCQKLARNPSKFQEEELRMLQEKKIVSINKKAVAACGDCRRTGAYLLGGLTCRHCGNTFLKIIGEELTITPSEKGIRKYVSNLLSRFFTVTSVNAVRSFKRTEYRFVQVDYRGRRVFFYVNHHKLAKNAREFLKRSALPICIIDVTKNSTVNDDELFSHYALGELLVLDDEEKLGAEFFTVKLEEQLRYSTFQIESNCKASAKALEASLNGIDAYYSSEQLEDDAFNLLKQAFPNAEKWGKEYVGKSLPEAVVGIAFEQGGKELRASFSWDCKYSQQEYFNLDRKESNKIRSYIRRLNDSTALRSFSKKLNAFFIICNKMNGSTMGNFAQTLKRVRKWNGEICFWQFDALYEFHKQFNDRQEQLRLRRNAFNRTFNYTFLRPHKKRSHILVDSNVVSAFFNKVLQAQPETSTLNTVKVKEYVEQDIL